MTVTAPILRRYVIDRAAGRSPRPEWSFFDPDLGAWIRADEMTARQHEYSRRIRRTGEPWCEVLGARTDVSEDTALQGFFATLASEDWSRLALAVMRRPQACLKEWQAAGLRIVAAVSGTAIIGAPPGPLSGWPSERGRGQRSMLRR